MLGLKKTTSHSKEIFIIYSAYLFLVCFLLLAIYYIKYDSEVSNYKKAFMQTSAEHTTLMNREFDIIKSDIEYISSGQILPFLKNKDKNIQEKLNFKIYRFIDSRDFYAQIRILDKDGQELVRVDKKEENSIIIPEDKLQNKASRYYFKDATKLQPDDIYISQLDLNKEFGKIEKPIKPMIRFVKPIYDDNLNFHGVVIFNYNAKSIIQKVKKRVSHQDIDLIWLNKDGQTVIHNDSNKNWSMMYKDRASLATLNNNLWQSIKQLHSGKYSDEDSYYCFNEYYPYKLLFKKANNILSDEKKWYLVLKKDKREIHQKVIDELYGFLPIFVLFILLGIALIWQLSNSRKLVEKEQEKNELSQNAFNNTAQAIIICDKNNKILQINDAFTKLTGYRLDEIKYKDPKYIKSGKTKSEVYESLWNDLKNKQFWEGTLWNRKKDGTVYPADFKINVYTDEQGEVKNYIALFSDISKQIKDQKVLENKNKEIQESKEQIQVAMEDLKSAQSQIIQSEKMAALGQLIAGIAHEINTPLGAINSSATNIQNAVDVFVVNILDLSSKLPLELKNSFITIIKDEISPTNLIEVKNQRAVKKEVMNTLKDNDIINARRYADIIVSSNMSQKIDILLPLLKSEYSKEVMETINKVNSTILNTSNIEHAVSRASRIVKALKNFSHQDSEETKVYGSLEEGIETVLVIYHNQIKREMSIVKEYQPLPKILCHFDELNQVWTNIIQNGIQAMNFKGEMKIKIYEDEKYQIVSICDTGCGMDEETKNKIFEPFFTTKPVGEGTGLGLDIVSKIIEKHNGFIEVESEVGVGTTFKIYIDKNLEG